jgi:hypothetical protein
VPSSSSPDVYPAVEVLFRERHRLPSDVLRSLAGIWTCASAARYGEPHERFWEDEDFTGHDPAACEAESRPAG